MNFYVVSRDPMSDKPRPFGRGFAVMSEACWAVMSDEPAWRIDSGPFPSEDEATSAARALNLVSDVMAS